MACKDCTGETKLYFWRSNCSTNARPVPIQVEEGRVAVRVAFVTLLEKSRKSAVFPACQQESRASGVVISRATGGNVLYSFRPGPKVGQSHESSSALGVLCRRVVASLPDIPVEPSRHRSRGGLLAHHPGHTRLTSTLHDRANPLLPVAGQLTRVARLMLKEQLQLRGHEGSVVEGCAPSLE